MIRIPSPGEYVLLQRTGRPDWPAMICTDDMAPINLQRPNGYLTLVLLIDKDLSFYYAASGELQEFVPIGGNSDKELQAAHNRVLESMDCSGSSLDYWRLKTEHQRKFTAPPLTAPTPTPSPNNDYISDQGSDVDEIEIAKRLSLHEWNKSKKRIRVSPSPPPPPPRRFKGAEGATNLRNYFRPIERGNPSISTESEPSRYKPAELDYIDGELSASCEMVKVHVGEQDDEFLIPKLEVEKLPFLSDAKIGCISTMEDGTLRLDLQCLKDFDPNDFRFVAEFLSTGQFGHSIVDEETREAVLQECVDAWPIADRIVLEDMLDHIVTKVQQAQLQLWEEAWVLALLVYETPGTPLGAYKLMKEFLVEMLAANFLEKVYDYGAVVIDRLRDLPELQRDVYKRLLATAEQQVNEN
ncbi:hypothetical protein P171DRAFT_283875 [Karstenula rhodostoma CBS 690.94]|uniref:PWWP domain-containing protein n=1 Tax=Karstenula rhodostoma CBS 690.94 TaxID=1392251 RepID=A0A9P4UAS1_9PLEO|nr:hypothetical protein P171DRAFT_283875 [Karstenula rhodostoma CBS 690.94]